MRDPVTPPAAEFTLARYRRRERVIRAALHAACAAAGAAGALIAVYVLVRLSASGGPIDVGQWIEERIKGAFWGSGSLLPEGAIRSLALRHPYSAMALVGGMAGLLASALVVGRVYPRFFDTFDPRVLQPVQRPRGIAFDGLGDADALPWTLMGMGERRAAWDELERWVLAGLADGETLGWAVLIGRPGAGKTRMAHELGRLLARRDVFGTRAAPRAGAGWRARTGRRVKDARAAWTLAAGAYVRAWRGRSARTDPWDVGTLHDDVRGGMLALLKEWRPRRPTLLLLDSPDPRMAADVLGTLLGESRSARRPFRHPVRLLVVSQTIPEDLDLRRPGTEWQSRFMGAREPIYLPDGCRFSEDEIRHLARQVLGKRAAVLRARDDFAHFDRVTDGNPLLVELALAWLAARGTDAQLRAQPLDALTRDGLLRERADRIRKALETAKAGDDALLAIAAATLCGGASREILARRFRNFSPERLDRAFPLDGAVLADEQLPPIRPGLIGDAFVRAVTGTSAADARQVVHAAWMARPDRALGAVLRLSSGDDRLAEALREGPPAEWEGSRVDVARAFATHHVQNGGDAAPAEREIGLLTPAEAEGMLPWLAGLLATPGNDADAGLACLARALERAMDDPARLTGATEAAAAVRAVADAIRAGDERQFDEARDRRAVIRALRRLLARAARAASAGPVRGREAVRGAFEALEEVLWDAETLHATVGASLEKRLATLPYLPPWERARLRVRAFAMRGRAEDALARTERMRSEFDGNPSAARALAQAGHAAVFVMARTQLPGAGPRAEALVRATNALQDDETDRLLRLTHARAWCCVGFLRAVEQRPDQAEQCARQVDALLETFGGPVAVSVRMTAWLSVVYALSSKDTESVDRAQALAEWMDTLGEPFPGDRWTRLCQVRAWESVIKARARAEDATPAEAVEALARRVSRLVRPFHGDPAFEILRANAWLGAVESHAKTQKMRAVTLASYVDALVAPFARRNTFTLARVTAWRRVAAIYGDMPDGAGAESTRRIAQRIEGLSQPFTADREIQAERTLAWHFTVIAYNRRTGTDAIEAAEIAARQGANLHPELVKDSTFAVLCANSWQRIGGLYAELPGGTGAEGAVRCAEAVEHVLRSFPRDYECQLERVTAYCHVARAFGQIPGGQGWQACEDWFERVETAAAYFVTEPKIAYHRVHVRVVLIAVHVNRPGVAGIGRATECVQGMDRLRAEFPEDVDIAHESAGGWRALAHAHAYLPSGRGAPAARLIAETVEGIANPHRADVRFAREVGHVWMLVARATAAHPGGDCISDTEWVARRVDDVAGDHPADPELAGFRAGAWKYVAIAYTNSVEAGTTGLDGLDGLERVIRHVDALADGFLGDAAVAREHALAWSFVVAAYAALPGGAGITRAEMALPQVDAIARRFPRDPEFTTVRVTAWTYLAGVRARLGDLDGVMNLVQQVDEWAAPFASVSHVAFETACAWMTAVFCCAHLGDASGTHCAEECLERIDALLASLSHDRRAVLVQLNAWRLFAATCVNTDSGGYAGRAEEQAYKIESLAAAYPDDADVAWECADTWRILACSAAPHDAREARRLGDRITPLAARFPGSERILQLVGQVDDCIARGHVPARADAAPA